MSKTPLDAELDPEQRVRQIRATFRGVATTICSLIAIEEEHTAEEVRFLNKKLQELQTAHSSLTKAEEAFDEKCRADGTEDRPDFREIRDQIGRALDRIRVIERASGISGEPD